MAAVSQHETLRVTSPVGTEGLEPSLSTLLRRRPLPSWATSPMQGTCKGMGHERPGPPRERDSADPAALVSDAAFDAADARSTANAVDAAPSTANAFDAATSSSASSAAPRAAGADDT